MHTRLGRSSRSVVSFGFVVLAAPVILLPGPSNVSARLERQREASVEGLLGQSGIDARLVGTWHGTARVANADLAAWTPAVRLVIAADGGVTGEIGEAALVRARLHRNRGPLGRLLRSKTEWIVDGELDGPLSAGRALSRRRIRIPFDLVEPALEGGFHASGGGAAVTAVVRLLR